MHIPVRPARSNEYDEVIDLVNRTFPPGDSAGIITTATVREDPRFRPDHLRVVERGGRIVGAVNLIDRFVHVGVARVRCAIVAPLVIWQVQKNKSAFVDYHGKEAVNFQITMAIAAAFSFLLFLLLIGLVLIWIVGAVWLIFTVIAAIKANNGEYYRYPLTIRLIK